MRMSPCRSIILLIALALAAGTAGCSFLRSVFGEDQGYLFSGYDTLALPGEEIDVKVRLQSGSFLRDKHGVPLRFQQDGRLLGAARTDDDGYAAVRFKPPAPGDYIVTAEAVPGSLKTASLSPVEALVSCREAGAPLVIVDLDKTLVAAGFRTVLVGDPPPMAHSVEVMNELARHFTLVYLTHRLEYFGPKSKAWLHAHGYPRGPVILADVREFLKGSGDYKIEVIEHLRQRFSGRLIGIGDKASDARAYLANGAEAFLLVRVPEDARAKDLRAVAHSIRSAPANAQVVSDWRDVRQAVVEGTEYPKDRFVGNLLRRAAELEIMGRVPAGR